MEDDFEYYRPREDLNDAQLGSIYYGKWLKLIRPNGKFILLNPRDPGVSGVPRLIVFFSDQVTEVQKAEYTEQLRRGQELPGRRTFIVEIFDQEPIIN